MHVRTQVFLSADLSTYLLHEHMHMSFMLPFMLALPPDSLAMYGTLRFLLWLLMLP